MMFTIPYRPTTNAKAERFHRTLGDGVRTNFARSCLPYAFWFLRVGHWAYNYARAPRFEAKNPWELRMQEEYPHTQKLTGWGEGCVYLNDDTDPDMIRAKFEPRGREGVILGYGPVGSYKVLDLKLFLEDRKIKIMTTRDVTVRRGHYPLADGTAQSTLSGELQRGDVLLDRLFNTGEREALPMGELDDGKGKCRVCKRWLASPDAPFTCSKCTHPESTRSKHSYDARCKRGRCRGHASVEGEGDLPDDRGRGRSGGDAPSGGGRRRPQNESEAGYPVSEAGSLDLGLGPGATALDGSEFGTARSIGSEDEWFDPIEGVIVTLPTGGQPRSGWIPLSPGVIESISSGLAGAGAEAVGNAFAEAAGLGPVASTVVQGLGQAVSQIMVNQFGGTNQSGGASGSGGDQQATAAVVGEYLDWGINDNAVYDVFNATSEEDPVVKALCDEQGN